MSRHVDRHALTAAIAEHLHAAGVLHYQPAGAYPDPSPAPIALPSRDLPPAPVRACTIRVYDDQRGRDRGTPDVFVQLRFRAPGDLSALVDADADAAFAALDDRTHYHLGGTTVRVKLSQRRVTTDAERTADLAAWERADSYQFTLD